MLTQDQLKQNIGAMEQQGARPDEIQAYLDTFKGQQPAPAVASTPAPAWQPNLLSKAADAVLGGASDLGVRGSQLLAKGVGTAAGALGFKGEQAKIESRLAQPSKNLFGAEVSPLQGGVAGAKQVAGAALKTGAEAAGLALAPTTIPGAIAAGAGVGALQGSGNALSNNASLADTAKQTVGGAVVGGLTGGIVSGLGKLVGAAGDKIMTSVIKPSRADVADGFSLDTVKQFNLSGSLNTTLEKTQNKMTDLTTQLKARLGSSKNTINLDDIYNKTVAELTDASKLKGFGANTKIASSLQHLKSEIGDVAPEHWLSIPDAQVIKQAAGHFGAWQYGKVDAESKASEIVFNTFYNKLKTSIEENSPAGVADINQQLSKLIPVANAVIRRLPVAERSNAISLNEMIGLVGSTFHPAALGPTLLNAVSRSGAAGSLLSKFGPHVSRQATTAALLSGSLASPAPSTVQSQTQ